MLEHFTFLLNLMKTKSKVWGLHFVDTKGTVQFLLSSYLMSYLFLFESKLLKYL